MTFPHFLTACKKSILTLCIALAFLRCSNDEFLTDRLNIISSSQLTTATSGTGSVTNCSFCSYVVPANMPIVDGAALGFKPGSIICLDANIAYGGIKFRNIVGTPDNPIIIRNCGGTAQIDGTGKHDALKTENSKYFRITGGDVDGNYGISITAGHMGVNLGGLSTDYELDHVKITKSGFAGIMAKTDPDCNAATWRENFLMQNVKLHHNYISDCGGEGIYAGNSFYGGMNTACGLKLPHEIHNIEIYSNVLENTGWDAIQLGCATKGASIHGNIIENYGVANVLYQNNGMQIGSGTGGLCYNNLIRKGPGNGIIVLGLGDNVVYNNIIDQAGGYGIFCDERGETPGPGFKFLNNTIIDSKMDGIRIYAETVPLNVVVNNIIANPGSYASYIASGATERAFVSKLNNDVKIQMSNNYFTTSTDSVRMADVSVSNYLLKGTSPVIDKGADVTAHFKIVSDFYSNARLSGIAYDIGAVEFVAPKNSRPSAHAGNDQTILLPTDSTVLTGRGSDIDGSIISYRWTQDVGPTATIANAHSSAATVKGMIEGSYIFRLTVTDNEGATAEDRVLVEVKSSSAAGGNKRPVVNAGPDQGMVLSNAALTLRGSASDSDGSIVAYSWQQYYGPPITIKNSTTKAAVLTFIEAGKYIFRLTVTDDKGATSIDDVVVTIIASSFPSDSAEILESRDAISDTQLPARSGLLQPL